MKKIIWLINRLKAMNFYEILYRIRKMLANKINKKKYINNLKIYELEEMFIDKKRLNKNLKKMFKDFSIDELNELDESLIYNTLGLSYDINCEIDWNKGINGNWDKEQFSKDIEFKNRDDIGDVRCSWEINRHQFMPYLAIMYLKTNKEKYFKLLENHFNNWNEENSFMKGINWNSSMEIAIRSYQWLIVIFFLIDKDKDEFVKKLSKSLIYSIKHVMKNLSLYSSANNHLILEVAISSIIGCAFNGVYNQSWFKEGYNILKKEIPLQFHLDGVNKEQALHYQAFETDMMLQYNSIMVNLNHKPIEEEIIKKSIIFIGSLESQYNYADFGDSDDAKIITLSYKKQNYYDYLLAFASQYYKEEFGSIKKMYNETKLFLKYNYIEKKHFYKNFDMYKNGGYCLINNNSNKILFDFGELGFGTLAAHGHADALMCNFTKNKKMFFVDSGTYIYNVEKNKRNYYRSTLMHNTLCFDYKNQSKIAGPFLWGQKAKSELVKSYEDEYKIYIKARHDGYKPYVHEREIEYFKSKALKWVIKDYFQKPAIITFVLDDQIVVEPINENIVKMSNDEEVVYAKFDGKYSIDEVRISKEFTKELKSKAIRVKYNFKKEHITFITDKLEYINSLEEENY